MSSLTRGVIPIIFLALGIIFLYLFSITSSFIEPQLYLFEIDATGNVSEVNDFHLFYDFSTKTGNLTFSIVNGSNVYRLIISLPRTAGYVKLYEEDSNKSIEFSDGVAHNPYWGYNYTYIAIDEPQMAKRYVLSFSMDMEPRGIFKINHYMPIIPDNVQGNILFKFNNKYRCYPNCFEATRNVNFNMISSEKEATLVLENMTDPYCQFQISMENSDKAIAKDIYLSIGISLFVASLSMLYSDIRKDKYLSFKFLNKPKKKVK
jgi:hypothetical protein